jgi:hypothetical protein
MDRGKQHEAGCRLCFALGDGGDISSETLAITRLHAIVSQKMKLIITTALRISDPNFVLGVGRTTENTYYVKQ